MNELGEIVRFMEVARDDARIGPMHVSLYVAILHLWAVQGYRETVEISARKLMPVAKIGGVGPYHRTIRQLDAYGYVKYEPSYNPEVPSRVYLLFD